MRILTFFMVLTASIFSQSPPPLETGVSQTLAIWRAARYSDVRYKLNLTLEKMSPVLKGTIEVRVNLLTLPKGVNFGRGLIPDSGSKVAPAAQDNGIPPIILDWRKIPGHEKDSAISNVTVNGNAAVLGTAPNPASEPLVYQESNEHLIFRDGVVAGENVIKLDFTSPILTSGSAITRYIDKEDGAEYLYSLFVPSDASTAFPVFDQPDLKARFTFKLYHPYDWTLISNSTGHLGTEMPLVVNKPDGSVIQTDLMITDFAETKPISTYVFAFAAGPFEMFDQRNDPETAAADERLKKRGINMDRDFVDPRIWGKPAADTVNVYVRKSQANKFKPHANEIRRLTREGIKYLETYFDYKFPWPKYDLVLIPEFPFGGMEHAGATFLRESSVIFPTEPTKGDYISRANLIFHETAHQWFGDLVTMRWFDDLWLKEGFAEFMAYKTLEKVMPDANAWKVFYERNKQAAYATDSTKGTTPIYQPIDNLSAAKSAYGNIVYRKAPSFLRQAEFYLGEDKFQTAVRAFLKKHEYGNAGWEDLVREFEGASGHNLQDWAATWVKRPGLPMIKTISDADPKALDLALLTGQLRQRGNTQLVQTYSEETSKSADLGQWGMKTKVLIGFRGGYRESHTVEFQPGKLLSISDLPFYGRPKITFALPNYQDYGYGIFLLDPKSREYVLKNIQNEKDPFLRSMMWGALWDSVREGEMDPREYVELAIKQLGGNQDAQARASARAIADRGATESDETIIQSLLGRVSTAMNFYMPEDGVSSPHVSKGARGASKAPSLTVGLRTRLEEVLIDRMQNAPTAGQRITFFRAFVSNTSTEKARGVLKGMLGRVDVKIELKDAYDVYKDGPPFSIVISKEELARFTKAGESTSDVVLRTKDKFDIVTRLIILGDPDAPKLLADLEKTETSDDAKRYAYAAHAALPTAENRARSWNAFVNNKDISESWIEAAMVPFNSIRHDDLSLPYLRQALALLPTLKRERKIFFVNGWLAAFIGGQRSKEALEIVNKFLADNPALDKDLRLKILENVDVIERAVKIRSRWP